MSYGNKLLSIWILFSMCMVFTLSAATINIMMIGDSITEGGGGVPDVPENNQSDYTSGFIQNADFIAYRGELWRLLKNDGYIFGTDLDFTGNRIGGSNYPDANFDQNHQGISGYRSDQIRDEIDQFLSISPSPVNMVLIHIGTNDPGNGIPIGIYNDENESNNTTVNNVKKILNSIFTANANTKVFVARIIEARRAHTFPGGLNGGAWKTKDLNDQISLVVENHPKVANIMMVNLESGAGMIYDPCGTVLGDMQPYDINGNYDYHPNINGYTKMAVKWHSEMIASGWLPNISSNLPEHLWALEEDSLLYIDSIGENNATCTGNVCPTPVTGQVNTAQYFNGSNQLYVDPDTSLNFLETESYSIEFWMNPNDSGTNQVIVGGNGTPGYFWIGTNSTKLKFSIIGTDDDGSIDIILNKWTHVALVKNAIEETIRVYIDGSLVSTIASPQAAVEFANGFGIGHLNSGFLFDGAIDEVALYRVALTGAEVVEHYINGGGTLDTIAPVITLVGANPQQLTVGDSYTELNATASDNVDGDISGNIIIDSSNVNMSAEGNYTVTYNVSDAAGNSAAIVQRIVEVIAVDVNLDTDGNGIPDVQEVDWFNYNNNLQVATITPTNGAEQSRLEGEGLNVIPKVEGNSISLIHALATGNAYITAKDNGEVTTGFGDDSTLQLGTSFKAGTYVVMKTENTKIIIETIIKLKKDEFITIGGN